jgi:hypothetical protein
MYQVAKRLASNPALSASMEKVASAINEGQSALMMTPNNPSPSQSPQY